MEVAVSSDERLRQFVNRRIGREDQQRQQDGLRQRTSLHCQCRAEEERQHAVADEVQRFVFTGNGNLRLDRHMRRDEEGQPVTNQRRHHDAPPPIH